METKEVKTEEEYVKIFTEAIKKAIPNLAFDSVDVDYTGQSEEGEDEPYIEFTFGYQADDRELGLTDKEAGEAIEKELEKLLGKKDGFGAGVSHWDTFPNGYSAYNVNAHIDL